MVDNNSTGRQSVTLGVYVNGGVLFNGEKHRLQTWADTMQTRIRWPPSLTS